MTQYNTLNVKLSNLQLNKWKSGIEYNTEGTLKISWNVVGNSNDENNFLHMLLLTSFCKWFISYYKNVKNSVA